MTHSADYIVVVSPDDDYQNGFHIFAEKVNRKIRIGYQLHGQPFVVERLMCQAMIKPVEIAGQNGHAVTETAGNTTAFYQRAVLG
ncbi:MAG TPA: hypothetical protein VMB22_08605 [Verrucomicrobiae bacterium]|nr:hypothetical protein [Verrucomicrobiae bacterium]